jgi:hypothetical protein
MRYTRGVNTQLTPESLLQQIARIQAMEQGKLCILRQGPNGPYYNLQRWENRHNVSEYVPANQLPAVQANLAAYAQFEALIEEYVHHLSTRSREQRLTEVKKKRRPPTSSSPKKPRSKR